MDNSSVLQFDIPPEFVVIANGFGDLIVGIVFISLHAICAYLIHKDQKMRNPTYRFTINLSIVDMFMLLAIGIYSGIILLVGHQPELATIIMGCLAASCWHVQTILIVLVAFSRWMTLTQPKSLIDKIFKKNREMIMHIAPYIVVSSAYIAFTIAMFPSHLFVFFPSLLTWSLGGDGPLGKYIYWQNEVVNLTCAVTEAGFNVMSLVWVHKTRKSILSVQATKNRQREIKLLIQCFVTGLVFFVSIGVFTIIVTWAGKPSWIWCLPYQMLWTSNHCVNPIVYLSINSRLRKRFLQLFYFKRNQVVPMNMTSSDNGSKRAVTDAKPPQP